MTNGNLKFSLVMQAVTDEFNRAVRAARENYQNATGGIREDSSETESGLDGLSRGVDGVSESFSVLQGILASVGIALSISQIAAAADAYKNLEARIKLVTGEGNAFKSAFEGVEKIALATNTSLEATGELFAKIYAVGKTMGIGQAESLKITETINQAIQLSGASAGASEAAVTQLIQGLQSGVFRGDEFNSVMEQAPRLSTALAASLSVTTGELRNMAEAGQLSADVVIKGLQSQAGVLKAEFATLPLTIGRAIQNLKTQFTLLIGETDKSSAVSEKAAGYIQMIADNLDKLSFFAQDAQRGIANLSSKLGEVDPKAIEALKAALEDMYALLKEFGVQAVESLGDTIDILNELANVLGGVESTTEEKVDAMTRTIQGLSIAFGFVRDGVYTLRIGYNLLIATLQETAGWFMKVVAFYALDSAERDKANAKAEQYFADAQARIVKTDKLAQEFQSRGMERAKAYAGDESALNARKLAEAEKTLQDIDLAEKEFADKHATYAVRKKDANDAYLAAVNSGNSARIESTKATLDAIEKEEKLHADNKAASDKKVIEAVKAKAQAMIDANGGILSGIIQSDKAFAGFALTLDEKGKLVVQDFRNMGKSAAEMGVDASDAALKAADALGVDLDVALNRLSKGFIISTGNVNVLAKGFDDLKKDGVDAANLLVLSLEELTKEAKNQAEIDKITALYVKFGNEGKLSTSQVEKGLVGIKDRLREIPEATSEVEKALKLLGVTSDAELKRIAAESVKAFNIVKNSGISSARERAEAAKKAATDEIAANNGVAGSFTYSEAAAAGLEVQSDSTGKTIVSAMGSAVTATSRATSSAHSLSAAYKDVGQQAQEAAAKSKAASDAAYENHPKELNGALNGLNLQHYSLDAVIQKFTSAGFGLAEATRRAKDIMDTDLQRRQEYARTAGFGNLDVNKITNAAGVDAMVAEALKYKAQTDARNSGSGSSFATPYTVSPPQVSNPVPTLPANSNATGKTIAVNFNLGGKQVSAQINSNDESSFLAMLEQAKGLS